MGKEEDFRIMMNQSAQEIMAQVKEVTGLSQRDIAFLLGMKATSLSQMISRRFLSKAWDNLLDDLNLCVTVQIEYIEPDLYPEEIHNQFHKRMEKRKGEIARANYKKVFGE